MSRPPSNEDVAKALQLAIRKAGRNAQLTASVIASATQYQGRGAGIFYGGSGSATCELIASRARLLSQEVDIFLALAKEGDARLQQGLVNAVQWGLLHLTDRTGEGQGRGRGPGSLSVHSSIPLSIQILPAHTSARLGPCAHMHGLILSRCVSSPCMWLCCRL